MSASGIRMLKPAPIANGKFLLHWAMLCVVIPMFSIVGNTTQHADLVLVFPAIVILYCGSRLAIIADKGSNRIVEITFWLYSYIFMGICAFLQIEAGRFPWADHYSDELIIRAQLLVIGGLVAFDLGKYIRFGRRKSMIPSVFSRFEISRFRLYLMSVIGMGIAVYATLKLGAFITLFLNRTERSALLSSQFSIAEMAIYGSMAKTIVYVLLIAALASKLYSQKNGKSIYLLIAILAIFTAVENNPVATARFQVGTILLSLFFVFPWKKYHAMLAIYGLALGLIIVFPYADLFRSADAPDLKARIERFNNENPLAVKVDYDSFQQMMNGIRMVQDHGLEYGKQITGALLFWIPRDIWHDKAEPTGQLIAEQNGYTYTNLSSPLWIEFYVDGGFLLVLCGFILYGAFVRWVDGVRCNYTARATPTYLFITIYAGYQIYLLRGSLMPAIAYLAPVVPVLLACGKWRRSRTQNLSLIRQDKVAL
jgi:oligosaccharide repeat unit polymerase